MNNSRFVYVAHIRTTPEKLWQALIDPEFYAAILERDLAGLRMEAWVDLAADDSGRAGGGRRGSCRNRATTTAGA